MEIRNNISFGEKLPTEQVLKRALNIHSYQDCKDIYFSVETKFPGWKGYNNWAKDIVAKAIKNNEFLKLIVDKLKKIPDKQSQLEEIGRLKSELGNNIDVEL